MLAFYLGFGFAIAATAGAIAVWLSHRRGIKCPRCAAPLVIDVDARSILDVSGASTFHTVEGYRCDACGGEFRQLDRGPLISLETWNVDPDFPQARIHRR